GQRQPALQDGLDFRLFPYAHDVLRGAQRLRQDLRRFREQHREYGDRLRYSESRQRACRDPDRIDLCGIAACLRCGNEDRLQVITNRGELIMTYRRSILAMTLALWQGAAWAQMSHNHAAEAACETTELRCATKVTPTFSQDGTLWLAWMAGGQVS